MITGFADTEHLLHLGGGRNMTYIELLLNAYAQGQNCADVALGRMMDSVEEETGQFPDWDDEAPDWIIKLMIGGET